MAGIFPFFYKRQTLRQTAFYSRDDENLGPLSDSFYRRVGAGFAGPKDGPGQVPLGEQESTRRGFVY